MTFASPPPWPVFDLHGISDAQAETFRNFPTWAVQAHLRALGCSDADHVQQVARSVLDRHADDEPSVESLTELFIEAERAYPLGSE